MAAKFFTTIRLGRVRGKELADTMGQVIPIASELGISLDEINSAMVALTIGGLDAHKSVTGLRGALTALLKPSTDMQKVIRELGFSSAEQLVGAKGLQGALQAVADASDNMASQIGKSVRNVRALTAELRLTQSGAKQVEDAMKAMQTSTPDMLENIYKQFTSTDSEKLTREINRLKIDLTQDVGSALTHALGSMMQFVGGADKMSSAIQAIAMAAIPAAGALTILAGAFALAHLSMGPIGWTLLGITAALSLFAGGVTYSTAQSINETRRLSDEQRKATLEYLKNKEEELRVLRETEAKKMAEENRGWENRSAVIRKDYFKALDNLRDKNKEIIESDRQAMQSIVASQERVVAAYRSAANAAMRIVQDSQNRRVTLESQASDKLFKDRLDMLYGQEDAEHGRTPPCAEAGIWKPKVSRHWATRRPRKTCSARRRSFSGRSPTWTRARPSPRRRTTPGSSTRPSAASCRTWTARSRPRSSWSNCKPRGHKSWRTRPPRSSSGSTR